MRGHSKKRSTWQFTIDLGLQPLQRCPACRKRCWTKREIEGHTATIWEVRPPWDGVVFDNTDPASLVWRC